MNVFHRFTRASLVKNRARTWVTVIGIVLSVALFTAVTEGAYSGVQFLVRSAQEQVGAFHGYYDALDAGQRQELAELDGVKDSTAWQQVGWAEIGSTNEYKPYLLIQSAEENFTDLVAVHIVAGRMPTAPDEILLPEHLNTNGGVSIAVGELLTLQVGARQSEGVELLPETSFEPDSEAIVDAVERTYTVVGIYQRFDYLLESYQCPGYTALTAGETGGVQRAFFALERPGRFYEWVELQTLSGNWRANSELLNYYGATGYVNINHMIYGFMGVLLFLIFFGSVSLIYNSFSISVSERTRQFGILKSVGATKKQIRGSVLYEALVLCAIGIPLGLLVGCTGIGITLYCLRDSFAFVTNTAGYTDGGGVQMRLVLHPVALLGAATIGLVTALVSAWIPARRAVAVSAIEAIRQSRDIAVRGRDVRTSALMRRLFGFEGMLAAKNFKRNRRRYRATVVSLFLSVTLFISASSFCAYLTDAVGNMSTRDSQVDLSYYTVGDTAEQKGNSDKIQTLIAAAEGVDEVVSYECRYLPLRYPVDSLHRELKDSPYYYLTEDDTETYEMGTRIYFVDDGAFRSMLLENGLEEPDYFNVDAPLALVWDYSVVTGISVVDGKKEAYTESLYCLDEKQMPITVTWQEWVEIETYQTLESTREVDGELFAEYYPQEYLYTYWEQSDNKEEPDPAQAMLMPMDEAVTEHALTLGSRLEECPFFISSGGVEVVLLYPRSMTAAVYGEEIYETDFAVRTADHRTAYDSVSRLLAQEGLDRSRLYDNAADKEATRAMVLVVNVFSYGFIILISLIAMANVFNTISTNIALRRREFAMLQSMGLGQRGFDRMMNYECLIYGFCGLLWGLPVSVVMTFLIYQIVGTSFSTDFYIPWYSVAVAVGSVFVVVFATMLYATGRIRRENPIDALKTENL